MRLLSKIASRVQRAIMVTVLAGAALVPVAGIFAPVAVSAAACTGVGGGAGGGGGFNPLYLNGKSDNIDSTVVRVNVEVKPKATWTSSDSVSIGNFGFADSGCTRLPVNLSFGISNSRVLTMYYNETGRTGAYVDGVDYDLVDGGVTFSGSSSDSFASATYTISSMPADTAQTIGVDLSHAGWLDIYLKSGAGSDTLLMSYKAPAGVASFFSRNTGITFSYSPLTGTTATKCADVTGSAELLVRVLTDGTPIGLTATPTAGVDCPSYDKTSYDSGTKTASLKYDVTGASVDHKISVGSDNPTIKTANSYLTLTTSLTLGGGGKYFSDYLSAGSSASQQVYFTTSESQDGKVLPKDTPWPIAGAVFDLTATDLDLTAKGVVFDTSPSAYTALAHKLNEITKDGSFTLYVPYRDGDKYVGVCPGAATIDAVTSKCTGIYYVKEGQTKTSKDTKSIPANRSVKASIVTVGTKKFWQVDGLTGTGVLSANIASDPDTGISVSVTSTPFAVGAMILTLGAAILARRSFAKK